MVTFFRKFTLTPACLLVVCGSVAPQRVDAQTEPVRAPSANVVPAIASRANGIPSAARSFIGTASPVQPRSALVQPLSAPVQPRSAPVQPLSAPVQPTSRASTNQFGRLGSTAVSRSVGGQAGTTGNRLGSAGTGTSGSNGGATTGSTGSLLGSTGTGTTGSNGGARTGSTGSLLGSSGTGTSGSTKNTATTAINPLTNFTGLVSNIVAKPFVCDTGQPNAAGVTFASDPSVKNLTVSLSVYEPNAIAGIDFQNVANLPLITFSITAYQKTLPPNSSVPGFLSALPHGFPSLIGTFTEAGTKRAGSFSLLPTRMDQGFRNYVVYTYVASGAVPPGAKLTSLYLTLNFLPGDVNSVNILQVAFNGVPISNQSLTVEACPATLPAPVVTAAL